MKQIQTSDAGRELEQRYSLRGRIPLQLDGVVVPVEVLGDFAGLSPYAQRRTTMDQQAQPAAGAGLFAGYLITPGTDSILVVERLLVTNATGAVRRLLIKLMRPADVAAITVTATSPLGQLNGRMRNTGFIPQVQATASIVEHTTTAIGAEIGQVILPTNETKEFPLSRGIVLDGTDPLGPIQLMLIDVVANQNMPAVGFQGSEYPVVP